MKRDSVRNGKLQSAASTKRAPKPPSANQHFSRIVENAIDFLNAAIDQLESAPKYSIIHFWAAVELFLKARLLKEHWSLVVSRDPNFHKFISGDFVSVTFEEAHTRLKNIAQSPLTEQALKSFDAIRKHRNKMVHFFHEDASQRKAHIADVAAEQLRAWSALNHLLSFEWKQHFSSYEHRFETIDRSLAKHKEYLRGKFESLKPELARKKSAGSELSDCASCGFSAAEINVLAGDLKAAKCMVCAATSNWLEYVCLNCSAKSQLKAGAEFECETCGDVEDRGAIADQLNEDPVTTDNYHDHSGPANCSMCDEYQSIIKYSGKYLCLSCFELTDSVRACGWCGELNNGDLENSHWEGCNFCDGYSGHVASKDD